MVRSKVWIGIAAGLVSYSASSSALTMLEEVVVTAQKREQNLQSTPLTIDVLSGDRVEKGQIGTIDDVANSTPGLSMDAFPRSQPRPFIRGIGSSDTGAAGDPSTAVYIDGVYMSRPAFLSFDSFDVERIEVLKGPQGTLWGRNVVGGLLHIINRKPDDGTSAKVKATAGNFGLRETAIMLNAPLIENSLLSRLTVTSRENSGYAENSLTGNELFSDDRITARLGLTWLVTDDLDIGLSINYVDEDNGGSARNLFDGEVAGLSRDPDGDIRKTHGEIDGFESRQINSFTLTSGWSVLNGELNAIANYKDLEYAFVEDFDGSNMRVFAESGNVDGDALQIQRGGNEKTDAMSFELRYSLAAESGAFWQTGIYYEEVEINQTSNTGFFSGLCAVDREMNAAGTYAASVPAQVALSQGVNPALALGYGALVAASCQPEDQLDTPAATQIFDQIANTQSYAAFAELNIPFLDIYSVTAGFRLSKDKKDYSVDSSKSELALQLAGNGYLNGYPLVATSDSWGAATGKITLDATFSPELFAYATISTGYKSGGFQDTPLSPEEAADGFDPEHLINYETGFKSEFWDGRARLNSTVFLMTQSELQVRQVEGTVVTTTNAGEAEIKGVELELSARLIDSLHGAFKYNYIDARFKDYVNNGVDYSGNRLSSTPQRAYTVNATYAKFDPLSFGGTLTLDVDYSWVADRFEDNSNLPPEIIESYALLGASVSYNTDRFGLQLWGKNLTNEDYENHYVNFVANSYVSFAAPRTYGVTVSFEFE